MDKLSNSKPTQISSLPVNALRAFLCTANHLSLTHAAKELKVTPGAVGRQVHQLEDKLNIKLVIREGNHLVLTPAGLVALDRLRSSFEGLCIAVDEMKYSVVSPQLIICVDASFSSTWLAPKLHMFRELNPECDIWVIPPPPSRSTLPRNVDFLITYLDNGFSDCELNILHQEVLSPVCTPQYLQTHATLEKPYDLGNHQLISVDNLMQNDSYPGWSEWYEKFCTEALPNKPTIHVALAMLAIQSALSNQGVALLSSTLIEDYLKNGELIRPLEDQFSIKMPRYVICTQSQKSELNERFLNWLLSFSNVDKNQT